MLKITYIPDAKTDVEDIYLFTSKRWGVLQAKQYILNLRNTIRLIAQNPEIGTRSIIPPYHCFVYQMHMIYFTFDANRLYITAILHTSRLPEAELNKRNNA